MNAVLGWDDRKGIVVKVTLSRRNLRALLFKVRDPDSKAVIARDVEPGLRLEVRAERDDVHYVDRPPGRMAPWTEAALQADLDGLEDAPED